jgi:hypothetical protein
MEQKMATAKTGKRWEGKRRREGTDFVLIGKEILLLLTLSLRVASQIRKASAQERLTNSMSGVNLVGKEPG